MKRGLFTGLLTIGLLSGAFAQNRSINFKHEGSFAETLAEAAKSNKLIFFDAYTSWCVPCKVLAKDVFTIDSIADFFNANFINVHYDMEKGEGIELKKRYDSDISGYPTLLFINGKGEIVHKIVGAPSAKDFLELSRPALNPALSLKGLAKKFEDGDHSAGTFSAYLKVLGNANEQEKAKEAATTYFDALPVADLKKGDVWTLMKKYLFNINSKSFKYILAHQNELSQVHGETSVNDYILANLSREVGALSLAYYMKKPVDEAKEAWLIKTLGTIHNDLAGELLIKTQLISSRNKGDWKTFNSTMTRLIKESTPVKSNNIKASLMLNFTRKFVEYAPAENLPDALNWIDLLLNTDIDPPYAIDLLNFKKSVLNTMGENDQLSIVDMEIAAQKKIKADMEATGVSFPMAIKGFM